MYANAQCLNCDALVGLRKPDRILFDVAIFAVTVISTIAVLAVLGSYYALIWFAAPVGALGYLKAKFSRVRVLSLSN
jgi:hypothetical protein